MRLFLLFLFPVFTAASEVFIRGDINCDGKVSVADLVCLNNFDTTSTEFLCLQDNPAADIDADGVIGASDISYFIHHFFDTSSPELPPPFSLNSFVESADLLLFPEIVEDNWLYDPGGGSDLEYIHFFCKKVVLQPGEKLRIPVILQTFRSVSGVSFALKYQPELFASIAIDVETSVQPEIDKQSWEAWTVASENRIAATCLFQFDGIRNEATTFLSYIVVANLDIQISPNATPGTKTAIIFENMPTPYSDRETWISNEISDKHGIAHGLQGSAPPLKIEISSDPVFVRGEINRDGSLDPADPIFLLQYLFNAGRTPECPDSADLNDDGSIDIADVLYLLRYLWCNGVPPEEPFPQTGKDLTPDQLLPCKPQPFGLASPKVTLKLGDTFYSKGLSLQTDLGQD